MGHFFFYLALATLLIYLTVGLDVVIANRQTKKLKDISPLSRSAWPKVSVIVAARNEERNIEEALQSVLHQDYAGMEIIVVNDRSTDRTGDILNRMAARDARLRPVHLAELPAGWLGKNHALYFAAQRAAGEYLLFTDADIVMHPATVTKAMSYALSERLDHLTLSPEVHMPGVFLTAFAGAFAFFFFIFARPAKAKDPKSRRFIGIGAFNLIRADAYRAAGTHAEIRMRPDDDMKLGKIIKHSGHRQEMLQGTQMIRVEWYASVGELIRGTEKNFFSGIEYSILAIIGASVVQVLFFVWPFAAIFLTGGATRILNLAAVLLVVVFYAMNAPAVGGRREHGLLFPVAVLMFVFLMWNSMLRTLLNGGINWRDTHYSLAELRANKV
jgi:Glycosyl transferase family 2